MLQLVKEVERIARLAVELVDKGKDRDMAHRAHAEQLARLRLNALGGINDHHGGVGRHQCAVGILREVLVSRGIENVDAIPLVLKLHHRGGDGNAALLFQCHPVGYGVMVAGLALDASRRLDRAPVKEELFGQGGLARVRVRDDGKGAAAVDLLFDVCHSYLRFVF